VTLRHSDWVVRTAPMVRVVGDSDLLGAVSVHDLYLTVPGPDGWKIDYGAVERPGRIVTIIAQM